MCKRPYNVVQSAIQLKLLKNKYNLLDIVNQIDNVYKYNDNYWDMAVLTIMQN